jgi:hypothetical protein
MVNNEIVQKRRLHPFIDSSLVHYFKAGKEGHPGLRVQHRRDFQLGSRPIIPQDSVDPVVECEVELYGLGRPAFLPQSIRTLAFLGDGDCLVTGCEVVGRSLHQFVAEILQNGVSLPFDVTEEPITGCCGPFVTWGQRLLCQGSLFPEFFAQLQYGELEALVHKDEFGSTRRTHQVE